MVLTDQLRGNLVLATVGQAQSELGAASVGGAQVQRRHVAFVGLAVRVGLLAHAKVGNGCNRTRRHAQHALIVSVQRQGTGRLNALSQLALGALNIVHAAELASVRGTNLQDCTVIGVRNIRQVLDVAHTVRTHLNDQVAGGLIRTENGQGHAHFTVVGADRGNGRALRGENGGKKVLGGGLTGRTGNTDNGQLTLSTHLLNGVARQITHRQHHIGHLDARVGHALLVEYFALDQRQGRAPLKRHGDEPVTVSDRTGLRHEQGTGLHLAGVGGGEVCVHLLLTALQADSGAAGCLNNLGGAELNHSSPYLQRS